MSDRPHIPSVEFTITTACVNSCASCNRFIPIRPSTFVSVESVREELRLLSQLATVEKLTLIGGEALLHPQILDLLDAAKESKVANKINITTNGQLIHRSGDELWSRLDRIEVGIYSGKMSCENIHHILERVAHFNIEASLIFHAPVTARQKELLDHIRKKNNPKVVAEHSPFFYKSIFPTNGTDEERKLRWDRCIFGHHCNTVEDGYLYRCPQSAYIPEAFLSLPRGTDGLSLAGAVVEQVQSFLSSEAPLESCRRCCSYEHFFTWYEVHDKEKWLEDATAKIKCDVLGCDGEAKLYPETGKNICPEHAKSITSYWLEAIKWKGQSDA